MPTFTAKLTDTDVRNLPLPAEKREELWWCPKTPGFGVRVSSTGTKAFIFERRVNGATKRRTLGKATGAGSISIKTARALRDRRSGELELGIDVAQDRKAERQRQKADELTVALAVEEYCDKKRVKGQPLKPRTVADYLQMLKPPRVTKEGRPVQGGHLHEIAHRPLTKLTAADIRRVYEGVLRAAAARHGKRRSGDEPARGERQASYAMQLLRAVLKAHGVTVPDSPLSPDTPMVKRIRIHQSTGKPTSIPPRLLKAWWAAASARSDGRSSADAADGLRLMLLTGCRPGEIFGNTHSPGMLARDVSLSAGTITLPDTKARNDHTVYLSRQALEILRPRVAGATPTQKLFPVLDPGKTLDRINAEALASVSDGSAQGEEGASARITPHKLRHTFGTVAARLVTAYALKRMMNHAVSGDVTAAHYVGVDEEQLREGWQRVADAIAPRE